MKLFARLAQMHFFLFCCCWHCCCSFCRCCYCDVVLVGIFRVQKLDSFLDSFKRMSKYDRNPVFVLELCFFCFSLISVYSGTWANGGTSRIQPQWIIKLNGLERIFPRINLFLSMTSYLSENPYISFRCCFKYRRSRQPCEATQRCSKIVGSGGIRAAM